MKTSHKKTIGITGGIGSGKSLISSIFQSLGYPVYDSDSEAKKHYNDPRIKKIITQSFGSDVYELGKFQPKVLGQIVFNNPEKLQLLNNIIHPEVRNHFTEWVSQQNSPIVFKEAAILIESGAYKQCDFIVSVEASEKIRTERVIKRDGVTTEEVKARIKKQMTDEERAGYADFVIMNNGSLSVIAQVMEIHKSFKDSLN